MMIYNEVQKLSNSLHDLVFYKFDIKHFDICDSYIKYTGKNLFFRLDYDEERQILFSNNIEISHYQFSNTIRLPAQVFTKQDYFNQSLVMNIPLSWEDIENVLKLAATFSKNTKRKFRIYIKCDS